MSCTPNPEVTMKMTILPVACLAMSVAVPPPQAEDAPPAPLTAGRVVERIRNNADCTWSARTVDTIKAGDPDTPVTGIATTCFASMDVLRRAAASGKKGFVPEVPVEFLPAGEPFWSPR
jgi:hypothetical protein